MNIGLKEKGRAFAHAVFLIFILPFLAPAAFAKSYDFPKVEITASLHPNRSMDVVESRTFRFDGSFSYAFRVFPLDETVAFSDFRVSENGVGYKTSRSHEPGTYEVTLTNNQAEVRWYFRAQDESRTFDVHYLASAAVGRYEDAGVLYFQFISRDWDRESRNVSLRVKPPSPLSSD